MKGFYEVRGLSAAGDLIHREFFVPSVAHARAEALSSGMVAVYGIAVRSENLWNAEYLGRDYRTKLLNALRFQVDAGVPIPRALQAVVEGERKSLRRIRLARALTVLERGGSLADALDAVNLFDEHVIALVRAGEMTGMRQAIRAAIEHEEAKQGTWRQVMAGVSVLSLELSTALTIPWSLHEVGFPLIRDSLKNLTDAAKLQEFAGKLDLIQNLNMAWMVLTYGLTVLLALWAGAFLVSRPIREKTWPLLRRFPFLGAYLRESAMSQSTKVSAVMLKTGIRLGETVQVMARTVAHGEVRDFWHEIAANLHNGHGAAQAFHHPLLSATETLAISAHQDAKQLGGILEAIAEERDYQRKRMGKAMMLASIAGMILYMAISMALALWAFQLYDSSASFNLESLQNMM